MSKGTDRPQPFRMFARDAVHAIRTLAKARAFTAVCVISLGLGIGTVFAILLLVRALLGTPAGVNANGLVEVVVRPTGTLRAQSGGAILDTWSYPDYLDVLDAATNIHISGWSVGESLLRVNDQRGAVQLPTMYVSSSYFATVGVTLARGSGFTPSHDASIAQPEAVVSYRLWQNRLGSDPNVIGRTIILNQIPHVVVGVAPDRYRGHLSPESGGNIVLWLPLSRHPRLSADDALRFNREVPWLRMVGRVPPGTTIEQADAAVLSVMRGLAERYPATNQFKVGGVEEYFPMGARVRAEAMTGRMRLFGLSGAVLLIVCVNISGMMLVRGAMRQREVAIRLAIGASRMRLVQYHLAEALVLALMAGSLAAGLIFGVPAAAAWWFDLRSTELDLFKPDAMLMLQCLALCFVTSLIFGLLPALRFSRPSIVSALKDDSSGGGQRVGRFHRLTAAVQAGIAVPFLVIGAVKLDQARVTALSDLGFKPQGLYAARVNLAAAGGSDEGRRSFLRNVQENLAQARGVMTVTAADGLPLDFNNRFTRVSRARESTFVPAHTTRVAPRYLETLGIGLLIGRDIGATDTAEAERIVLLSEPLARQLFPARDPLGERVEFALEGSERTAYTVVGVTGDLVSTQMGNPRPQLFVALAQHPTSNVLAIARGPASDPSMRQAFEDAITDVDPDFVLTNLITGDALIDQSQTDLLSHSALGGALAAVALILAALGVYGVIGFMVATRTREIGVRVALGATRRRVLDEVLVDALKLVVPGIGGGLVLAILWIRVADPSWYPLGGVEPLVYTFATATAFLVAVLAGIPSARRAAAVDPIVAMRC